MGRIKELIKSFINPVQEEGDFDELAVAAGIDAADLTELKKSMGGVKWSFDEEEKEKQTKKGKTTKTIQEVPKSPITPERTKKQEEDLER